ncbi:MAG: hypothetical protein RSC43_06670, partial [Clostridia bacterium]
MDGGVLAETTNQSFLTGDALAVYVNGTNIVTEPGNSIQCGAAPENKATYDAATNTLTLTDATIDKTLLSDPGAAGNGIFSNAALNIVLVGNSKIAGTDITSGVLAIDALTLSGSGSLEITTSDECISSSNGDIIFNGGTYNLKASGEMSAGIWGNRVITVGSGVRLTTVSEKSNGMYLSRSGGTITINDGAAVVAKGDNRGINANNGAITVAKNAALLAERTNAVSGAAMDYRTCTLGGVDYPKSNKDPIVNYRNGAFTNPLTKLIVNGKNLLEGESVPGVSFNGTDTITLNNATLDTPSIDDEYICAKGDLSIIVQGDNKVMMNPGTTEGEYVYGIAVYNGSLDISGSGKLSILMDTGSDTLVDSTGIFATGSTDSMGNISIKDIELDIKMMSTTDDCAIYGVGNVTLTNTRGTILGTYVAIAMNGPATVNGMSYDTGYSKLELTPEGFIGSNTLFLLKIGNVDIVKNFEAVENPDLSGIMTRGSYSLDLPNSTLTLNGASIAAVDVQGIQFCGDLTINTTAASDISASGINDASCIYGADDNSKLTLKGGPLTMVGGDLNGGIVLVDVLNADAGASATITAGSNLEVYEIFNADGSDAKIPKFGTVTLKDGTFSGEIVTPTISVLPTASAITYGETLEKSTLKGGEALYRTYPVDGTFAWKTATEKPAASGLANYKVTFTPDSLGNFNPFDFDVSVMVNKAAGAAITDNIGGSYTGNGTDFTYTVTPIVGAEYKIDSGTWQDSNIFSGIVPASTHTFSARMKADANHEV